jgi:hypothetical protein
MRFHPRGELSPVVSPSTGELIGNSTCGCAILTSEFTVKRYPMATKSAQSKSAHWQAAFRRRMREAGLKALTVWLPKESVDRLARYPEKERGEVITQALALLESQGSPQGQFTGNDTTLTGRLTGESRDFEPGEAEEDTLTLAGLFTRLERVEAILSTITSNSTGKLTGDDTILTGEYAGEFTHELTGEAASHTGESIDKSRGEVVVTVTETPLLPVAELTATLTETPAPQTPVKLPPKRVAALSRRAKKLFAQGVSWKEIARRFNAEGIPTLSGIGQWYGSTVAKFSRNE